MTTTFSFGKNWQNFLGTLDEEQIHNAENSLRKMLNIDNLQGKTFLDAGCGSGLFSLAALRLGAEKVVSFDLDEDSVACARHLYKRYGPFQNWEIRTGSVLDTDFLLGLGEFDVVYSWGVLHHTGKMWDALNAITTPVTSNGKLFIAIYNDQGFQSQLWLKIKQLYNTIPKCFKFLMATALYLLVLTLMTAKGIIRLQLPTTWFDYGGDRGMNIWHDVVDWIGGYPFETATSHEISNFYQEKNFTLTKSIIKTGLGCNEFVFHNQF